MALVRANIRSAEFIERRAEPSRRRRPSWRGRGGSASIPVIAALDGRLRITPAGTVRESERYWWEEAAAR